MPPRPRKPAFTLRGSRILLRYPRPADRAEYLALKRASRRFLTPWEATPEGGADPFSPAAFTGLLRSARTESSHRFLLCLQGSGPIIGQVGLSSIIRGPFQSCFLGYWIAARHVRHGYMSEAIPLALLFAFRDLGLHRVEANIIPTNRPSLALIRKLGFRYEGTARSYLRINHTWQDHEHWAITRED
jgi:[ribosomal protein S5]-alanine N-acetyltransferase